MGQPVVHFEITGEDADKLRHYYGDLFGWEFDTSAPVAEAVSRPGNYGFVNRNTTPDGVGIPGGVGGGAGYKGYALFYVGVPDVEAALQQAERLGGKRVMGPVKNPGGQTYSSGTSPIPKAIWSASPAPNSPPAATEKDPLCLSIPPYPQPSSNFAVAPVGARLPKPKPCKAA